MNYSLNKTPILIADDDEEDRRMIQDALNRCHVSSELHFVSDGQTLLDFLRHTGTYASSASPRPGLILLDLNMPRKSGRRVLQELKDDSGLSSIPVIVLTTSDSEEDVLDSYRLGANSFITKPVTFEELIRVMDNIKRYWLQTATIPHSVEEV